MRFNVAGVASASALVKLDFLAPPVGFEPTTHGLGNRCSIP